MPIAPSALLDSLRWRYATKRFDPARRIPPELWSTIEDSLVLSASSYGLQPYRFVVVADPALRAQLRPVSWNQSQIVDASHLLVFAARTDLTTAEVDHFLDRTAEVRAVPRESLAAYRAGIIGDLVEGPRHAEIAQWTKRQAYLALGSLLVAAAQLGIDACPIEGFSPADYDRILDLPAQGLAATVVCALGYRSADDKYASLRKVRFPREELVIRR